MTVRYDDWYKEGNSLVPRYIKHRYCPTNDKHLDVEDDLCPVCGADIIEDIYTREKDRL